MNQQPRFAPPFQLGEWEVHPDRNRVSGPGGDVRVEPRVMSVLVRLTREPGEVVSRLDLLDDVWGDTVVGEEILTRAISELRRIFGDRARDPSYIETIINRGYRTIAPVAPLAVAPEPPQPPAGEPIAAAPPATTPSRGRGPWLPVLAVAVVLVALALLGPRLRSLTAPTPAPQRIVTTRAVPLTTFPGHERHPAVTSDGTRIAFVWEGPDGRSPGVWVKQRNSETPLRLTDAPGRADWPVWSPDGQTVAWVQMRDDFSEIRTVSSLGGASRTLLHLGGVVAGLDWSPDGRILAFSARDSASGRHSLRVLDMATLVATEPELGERTLADEIQPRFSPDGERLAWIRLHADGTSVLYVSHLDGRARPGLALEGLDGIEGLAWTSDGMALVAAAAQDGLYNLWRVGADGSGLRRLTDATEFAWNPSIARGTGDLVFEQVRVDQDFWRIQVHGRDPWQLETGPFLTSTRWEYEAEFSPDGERLAFVSARSGTPELWVCASDGANPRRLTETGGAAVTRPRWSPDGARIACNVTEAGDTRIWVVPAEGGRAPVLDPVEHESFIAWWGGDGSELMLAHGRGEERTNQLRDVATGALQASDTLPEAVAAAFWVGRPDTYAWLVHAGRRGIHRMTWTAGPATDLVVPGLDPADHDNWRPVPNGLYWVMRSGRQAFLMVHDLETGRSTIMTDLPGFAGSGLAVSPDGTSIVYPRQGSAEGDLMLFAAP